MKHEDALRGIESAAAQLHAEKAKLDAALERLRESVEVLDPGYTLLHGALARRDEGVRTAPEPPSEEPPEPEAPPETPRTREREAEHEYLILEWLRTEGPKLHIEVEKHFATVDKVSINRILQAGIATKVLKRSAATSMRYVHKDYSPKVTVTKPAPLGDAAREDPTPRGSGTRQDTAGAVTTTRRTPSPGPIASTPGVSTPPSATDERGLARSPKPRSEMRDQQRESEERLDTLVRWAQDQGDTFTALDALADLYGRDAEDKVASMITRDFRILAERGVIEKTGTYTYPKWKREPSFQGAKGRSTPEYRLPKAEPAPASSEPVRVPKRVTQENVRDVMVEHKRGYTGEICEWLGIPNVKQNRDTVTLLLTALERKGIVKRHNGEDNEPPCWVYKTITDEGAAARFDRANRRNDALMPTASSAPVAGTGRGIRVGNKEVQQIVDAAIRNWGQGAVQFLSKHIRVNLPEGGNVTIAHTPNQRGLLRDKAKLRKAGLALA